MKKIITLFLIGMIAILESKLHIAKGQEQYNSSPLSDFVIDGK